MGFAGLQLALSQTAHADGIPFEALLATTDGHWLLTKSPATAELFARISGAGTAHQLSREELLNLARVRLQDPRFALERAAVEEKFRQIHDDFGKAPRSERARAAEGELSHDEKVWLNEAAAHIKINPEWHASIEGEQSIEFFSTTSTSENFASTRENFMRQVADPALTDDGSSTPVAERPAARARVQKYFSELKSCVSSKPPTDLVKMNYKYMLTQLAIDETMTTGGAIIAAGGMDGVDWKTLPNDLAFEAFASVGDSLIATMPNGAAAKYDVRWWRIQGFGVVQSGADAVIYSLSQSKEKHNVSTSSRLAYNAAWNAGYGKLSMSLYDLIAGLECIGASNTVVVGTQIGVGLGANVAYFGLRNHILGKNSE